MTQATLARQQKSAGHPVAGSLLAISGGLLWLIPVAVTVFVVPRFVEVFEKCGKPGQLPAVTQAVMAAANGLSVWWPAAALVWLGVLSGLGLVCVTVRKAWPVYVAALFAGLSLLGAGVAVVLIVLAMFLPTVTLVETLGQG